MSDDLRMFMEDGCVVIDAPGYLSVNEEGEEVVTYPPPAKLCGTDPSRWPKPGWRVRITIPKDMVIETSGLPHQLDSGKFTLTELQLIRLIEKLRAQLVDGKDSEA